MYAIEAYSATIYARVDGTWDNTNTWSTTGPTGASCSCTPSSSDSVVINGREVSITATNVSIGYLTITNAINDHAFLQVSSALSLSISNNLWVKAENYNKNVELIITQDGSAVNVSGNVLFERASNNSKSQYLRLNMSNNTDFTISGNFTYNYLSSSGAEGNDEILMIDQSNVNIGGNFNIRMDGGNNFVITQSNTSLINITGITSIDMNGGGDFQQIMDTESKFYCNGNMLVDIDGGENFLVSMTNTSGTEHYKVNGNLAIDKVAAEDVSFNLSNSAELKIAGDYTFSCSAASANNSDMSFLLANSAKVTISGNTSISMNEATVINSDIIIDMDNTSQFNMGVNDGLLAKSCSLTMTKGEILRLEMDRDASLNVYGSMNFNYSGSEKLQIHLNQNIDGSGNDAQLRVDGNFTIAKTDGMDMQLYLSNDADLDIRKNMNITFGDSDGIYSGKITLNNNAGIEVDSNATITNNCSNQTNNDFTITLNSTSFIKVGPWAGPYTEKKLTLNLSKSRDFLLNLNNSSVLTVYGNLNIVKSGGRNFTMNPAATSGVYVYNDLDLDNTEDADLLYITLGTSAILDVNGNIDMQGALSSAKVELELNSSSALHIGKNFLRNASPNTYGILDARNTSTVYFDGTSSQILAKNSGSGTDGFTYQNVTINNSSSTSPQITMEGSVIVNGTLNLTNGKVQTSSANYLEVASAGGISGGSANSHIIGPLRKAGTSAFTFMVGNGTSFGKIGIAAPSTNSTFEAEYQRQSYSDISNKDVSLYNISSIEYWMLNRVSGTGTCKVILYWDDANASGIANLSDLVVAKYNSSLSKWENLGQSATTGGVGDGVSGSITSNLSPTSFSPFTFGSITSSNPLPVEWLYFTISDNDGEVELQWATATEINNAYFFVERSTDGINFETIQQINGAGNSNSVIEYIAHDAKPIYGTSYYRLRQVDFNGEFAYSNIQEITLTLSDFTSNGISLFPNPVSKSQDVTILANKSLASPEIYLYDLFGRLIYSAKEESKLAYNVQLSSIPHLIPGIYSLLILDARASYESKIVITE